MLSASCVLSHPHDNPVSCELNCPILQVRKLRLRGDVTCQLSKVTQPGRKWWCLCNPLPPPPSPPPGSLTSKPKHLTTGVFLSGQLSGLPARIRGPLSVQLLVCLPQALPQVLPTSSAPPAPGRPCRDSDGVPQGSPSRPSSGVAHQHRC